MHNSNESATVIVTEMTAPNAGNSNVVAVCSNGNPLDLFSVLSGSPSLNGSWSGPSILTAGYLGTYDPSTFTPGVYTYSVAATACVNATSTVTISETPLPNAGINDSIVLCSNSDPVNLFLQLTGNPDSTGIWSGNSILLGNHLGAYDAVTMNPGVYTYSVMANGACTTNESATVIVTEMTAPNAGNSNVIAVCSNGNPLDLFSVLSGSPSLSGSWSGPSILTSGYLGTYDPSTLTPGVYTYSVAANACVNATSTVTISDTPLPNAGINDSIVLCSNSDPVNLFLQLTGNPDSTGTWSGNSILLGNHLGTYDAVTMNPGVYTYSVLANGACTTNVNATVMVTEMTAPNAGKDSTITICSDSNPLDLFIYLGGLADTMGIWTGNSVLGNGYLGSFEPFNNDSSTYIYTSTSLGCSDASSTVTVLINIAPVNSLLTIDNDTICTGNTSLINASVGGGLWSSSNSSIITIDSISGLITTIGSGFSTISYEILGINECFGSNSLTSLDVFAIETPVSPNGNSKQFFCENNTPTVENLLVDGQNIHWYKDSLTSNELTNNQNLENESFYYATQTIAGCESLLKFEVFVTIDSLQLHLISKTIPTCNLNNGNIVVLGVQGIGNYSYFWSDGESGNANQNLASDTYIITVIDSVGCVNSLSTILDCKRIIPEIITPNGDGKNDTWILNLKNNASVHIYNRWGHLVYTSIPYLDNWEGKSNQEFTTGNGFLPNGTYYYFIDYNDESEASSGFIELMR